MLTMPKRVYLTDAHKAWLKANHAHLTYDEQARHIGCCVDTLKRILVREGLQEFDGAKYQVSRDFKTPTWQRPCMSCGDTKTRPKAWFFCRGCRAKMGYEDD